MEQHDPAAASDKTGTVTEAVPPPRTPSEVSLRFADAINAGDLDAALACWSTVGVIASPDGPEVRGREALAALFASLVHAGARMSIAVADEVCTALGATATTRLRMTTASPDWPPSIEATAVVVYVPGPHGLQILIDRLGVSPSGANGDA